MPWSMATAAVAATNVGSLAGGTATLTSARWHAGLREGSQSVATMTASRPSSRADSRRQVRSSTRRPALETRTRTVGGEVMDVVGGE